MTFNAKNDYTATGTQSTTYNIGFDYLLTTHITVQVGPDLDNLVTKTLETDYELIGTTAIRFKFGYVPASGQKIRIKRSTPADAPIIDFQDGSVLTESDLDNATLQPLYVAAEVQDTGSIDKESLETYIDSALSNEDSTFAASATPQAWSITSTGASSYALTSPTPFHTNDAYFIVAVGGALQRPTTDFSVTESGGTYTLSFTSAPVDSAIIQVQNFGRTRDFNNATSIAAGAVQSDDLAAGIGVKPEGAAGGAATRSFAARFSDVINVKDYGAVGNNVTNDQAAVQDAINDGEGKIIYFPPGDYLIEDADLTIDVSKTMLRGEGEGSRIHLNARTIKFDADTANALVEGCVVKDLFIDRTGSAGPCIQTLGDSSNLVQRFTCDNVRFKSTGEAIEFQQTQMVSIINCDFTTCAAAALDASDLSGTYDYGLQTMSVVNSNFLNGGNAFKGDGSRSVSFTGCHFFNHTGPAIDLENACRQTTITGCRFHDDSTGGGASHYIVAGDTGYGGPAKVTGYGLIVTNCQFQDEEGGSAKTSMINLTRMEQVLLDSCTFEGTAMTSAVANAAEAAGSVTGRYRELATVGAIDIVSSSANGVVQDFQTDFPRAKVYRLQLDAIGSLNADAGGEQTYASGDADNAGNTIDVQIGDWVMVSGGGIGNELHNLRLTGHVTTDRDIKILYWNNTAASITTGAATLRVMVIPHDPFLYGID